MCSICKEVLQDFSILHTEALCPLRNSRYCSYCAQYGHLTKIQDEPQQLLEIKDDDKVIAAYLSARSIKAQRGFTRRQSLEEYAKLNNKRVVYIP